MRKAPAVVIFVGTVLVAGVVAAVGSGSLPLGVRGEWEWLRVPYRPDPLDVVLAGVGVLGYATVAALGMRSLARRATPVREVVWVGTLVVCAAVVQGVVQTGAPVGYGLSKWVVALHMKGSSGYFTVAKQEARDLPRFLADYPTWVRGQDALHIGTHPPGLIAAQAAILRSMAAFPRAARLVEDLAPESVAMTLRTYGRDNPLSPADRATLVLTGFVTLVFCAGTVGPLYALARSTLPAPASWASASLWPLATSAVMFQPAADAAFPAVSTTALALTAWAVHRPSGPGRGLAALAGVALGLGMQLSLVFLAVGLVVGVVVASSRRPTRCKVALLAATGVGFLGVTFAWWAATGANPFAVWWWNQRNHARFYSEFHRSYWAWVAVNGVELAVGLGLPSAVLCVAGSGRKVGVSLATFAVLALLTLSGRNLSEVARLWLPFMPALLVAAGSGMDRAGGGEKTLAAAVVLTGAQTLALQCMVQVVYPV